MKALQRVSIFTNSVAIISDAIHDFGDALSIGFSYFLEKKSKHKADETYSYGYSRFSTLGAVITTLILIIGSVTVIINAIERILNPETINHNGMIIFAIVGIIVNFLAAYFTHGGESLNQKAVNLHMLEDVLGWIVVLIGSIVIKFTNLTIIDAIMSIGVACFIIISAVKNSRTMIDLFLDKVPKYISIDDMKKHLESINGVDNVHHLHIWGINETTRCATLHVMLSEKIEDISKIKELIREEFHEHGVGHVTIEIEIPGEVCQEPVCDIGITSEHLCSHHHGNLGIHHHHH